jgi:hypothetical protein
MLYYASQYVQTKLSVPGGINDTDTTNITLQDVTGIDTTKPGIGLFDYSTTLDVTKAEWFTYTSINGSKVCQGVVRGAEGSTAKAHNDGCAVAFPMSKSHINNLNDAMVLEHDVTGHHSGVGIYNSLNRQTIINGNFVVNQRVYVSNAALAAGVYGHDRWKAGSGGGDYTFTQLPSSTTITIKTGKSLIQVIEDKNVVGGTYTLSWTGTAQARFGKNSATPSGTYAASPLTITGQTAGTVMSVESNEGTLGLVHLDSGSVALLFMPKSFEEELRACWRYTYVPDCTNGYSLLTTAGFGITTTRVNVMIPLPVTMRTEPAPYQWLLRNFGTRAKLQQRRHMFYAV